MKFTPVWKDEAGNRLVFPARNTIFDNELDAQRKSVTDMLWMMPFGLSSDGILSFTTNSDGDADLPHVMASCGRLGPCALIAGPKFDAANAKQAA